MSRTAPLTPRPPCVRDGVVPFEREALVPRLVRRVAEAVACGADAVVVGALFSGPPPLVAGFAAETLGGSPQSERFGEAVAGRGGRGQRFECVDGDQPEAVLVREPKRLVPLIFAVVDKPGECMGHGLACVATGLERCDGRPCRGHIATVDAVARSKPQIVEREFGPRVDDFVSEQTEISDWRRRVVPSRRVPDAQQTASRRRVPR